MKRYCLTDCAKRKLKAWQKIALQVIVAVVVIVGIVIVSGGVIMGVGYLVSLFTEVKVEQMISVGAATIMISFIFAIGIYWLYLGGKYVGTGMYHFAKDRYEGEAFECKIFEECE